ncbi:PLP-dependent transferase [Piromyces finnis]|uniref:aspartate transaminase n=1 Tax=Piromyces finnis TaxID=1754191 RepID=A0A1Y1VHB2_9FUNG|nr:PLP-dependent transferase [Piromyces finnis]|eukprot:ORX55412.1 PLP-dependent transferase [Piromyces finnis]
MSRFNTLEAQPKDPIFALVDLYQKDENPNKINISVGAYRDENGNPYVLPVVKKAKQILLNDPNANHEYNPMTGVDSFCKNAAKVILGKDSPALIEDRCATIQTVAGTGALKIACEFLKKTKNTPIYISNPTWANHKAIIEFSGLEWKEYSYWCQEKRNLNIDALLEDMMNAPDNSTFLLHACAHNPTGTDPTKEEWKKICEVMKKKNHFPFFDCAYQGFASGSLENDAWAIRYFLEQGFEAIVCQSFSKNMGLYSERAGYIHVIVEPSSNASEIARNIRSNLSSITRSILSNAPNFAVRIVDIILSDPQLYNEWIEQMNIMSGRIQKMRKLTRDKLVELKTPGTWDHIQKQIGMFSFTGLTVKQVECLIEKFSIYMTKNGRMSVAGLTEKNVDYFCKSVDWVVRNIE